MNNTYTRSAAAERVRAVATGKETLDGLQRWLSAVFVSDEFPGPCHDEVLLNRLMFLFEDESVPASVHVTNAGLIAEALESALSNDRVLNLLPLLVGYRHLCGVVGKYRGGVISRTGFLSFVAELRYSAELRAWLQKARPEDLDALCTALRDHDVAAVETMLPGTE